MEEHLMNREQLINADRVGGRRSLYRVRSLAWFGGKSRVTITVCFQLLGSKTFSSIAFSFLIYLLNKERHHSARHFALHFTQRVLNNKKKRAFLSVATGEKLTVPRQGNNIKNENVTSSRCSRCFLPSSRDHRHRLSG